MGRNLLLLGVLLVLTATAYADGIAVGETAPELPEVTWLLPPEAKTLEGLRGHVVLLHVWGEGEAARAWPRLDFWQETFWRKGLRVVVLAADEAEAVEVGWKQRAFAYAVGHAKSLGPYDEAAKSGATMLLDAAGKVIWRGKLSELDTVLLSKTLRKVKLPALEGSAEALEAWTQLAARCAEVGIPALAVDAYDRIEKAFKKQPEAEDAAGKEKALKKDKQAKKEISAAKSFGSLASDFLKAGDNDRKKQSLAKRIDKFLPKNEGTRAGTFAAFLVGELSGGAALAAMRDFIAEKKIDTSGSRWRTHLPKPPKMEFDPTRNYTWVLETSEGDIRIRLLTQVAPMHCSSTIYLTELGFYDGLKFHRVINGFMAQGGCPLGSGTGGPGYEYAGEFDRTVRHDKGGLLSMANRGPGTDGSQFFLTFRATRHLDDKHTIFGEVVKGMDTVERLEKQGTQSGTPKKEMIIEAARIEVE